MFSSFFTYGLYTSECEIICHEIFSYKHRLYGFVCK